MAQFFYKTIVGGIITGTLLAVVLAADPELLLDRGTAESWGLENASSLGHFLGNLFWVYFLLLFLMVCTGGTSLVIVIPVGYGVGWIAFEVVGWIAKMLDEMKSAEDAQRIELKKATPLTRDQQALVNYIKKAREKGLPNQQITQNLTNNGWPTTSIAAAFQMAGNGV